MKKVITYSIFILLFFCFFIESALSIPAFARKYNLSCNVCHYVVPKLKPFGDEFVGNGFQIPDKEPQRFYRNTGDPELTLMREFPFAVRLELYGQLEKGRDVNPDFRTPYIFKFMSGGNIAKDISYYFYYFISERGEMAGIEDAFVMFNDLFNQDLDFYVGQFQVSDPLFKRELRLTIEDYKIYSTRVGNSLATLKYERGFMFTYGIPTKTDITFEIVNGNGIDTKEIFDVDKYKNFLLRVSQDVNEHFRIGAFGYYGKEKPKEAFNPNELSNEMFIIGGDFSIMSKYAELNVQYVYRSDDNPKFLTTIPSNRIKTQGGFAELILSPDFDNSKWFATLLFNKVESDYHEINYESYTASLSYNLKRNIRITGEYTYERETESSRGALGLWIAF
ncbi:MAG: hypothetical protein N2490_03980 [Ignavibacteria bacterium]|nr:hypothetical protein [Ignavibacteria bacterium]